MVEDRVAPACVHCGGLIKPDVVFFGEGLPPRFGRLVKEDLRSADLLIVMGTSLTVAPVSMIPSMVDPNCRRVLLNREVVGDFNPGGGPGNHGDVYEGGNIDDSILRLCRWLGWEDELREMNVASGVRAAAGGGGDDGDGDGDVLAR